MTKIVLNYYFINFLNYFFYVFFQSLLFNDSELFLNLQEK